MSWLDGLQHFVRADEPLAPRCWLRIGGPADYLAEPPNLDDLVQLVRCCREQDIPMRLLGEGSNLIIRDQGVRGVVISLPTPAFGGIKVHDSLLEAGGGAMLAHAISAAVGSSLGGLEPLVGIPGTIGGALHGNAGDRAADVGQLLHDVTVLTRNGDVIQRDRDEVNFAYRQSSLDELAILSVRLRLEPENREELTRRMQKQWIVKRTHQPSTANQSCYVFKDPQGMTAAELIEQAGLKGRTLGGATLYDRNPNFVILDPAATCDDLLQLIDDVRAGVESKLGVDLETAVQIW